jgi:hypothetical protein
MNEMHEANRRHWESAAHGWQELRDQDQLWRKCREQPDIAFAGGMLDAIREFVGELAGKRICVIGSGDNYAAFALAGMGAIVTSTDILAGLLLPAGNGREPSGLEK